MKVIKATQQMLETRTLVLGFQGENLRTQLRIDCSPTFAEYPNATPALAIKPPSGETYPVFVERDGNEVVWNIVANNLLPKGDGELQLTFYKDNVIAKTSIGHITVNRSLQIDGEMPDVVATWIENANRKLAEVDAQIVELEGMVDTATDAATRAEQSASTSSTKAEQAAGSAATATAKANEATQAAGTATAKAAEAQTAAQTATAKATAAADSERIATAKAVEATIAAGTATAKAEQATGAAQTATEKAGDASASATAAQTSATNAASSATAASASETAAKASETAAGASATQAAQSVLDAGANAQTAMQKAAEATQSATNAATSATNAATSAETASTKAGEAAQSAQAVEETAEQLAESLEQIDQNTQDIAELDERKANIDGYYPDMTVGNAEQLNSSKYVENSEPYTLRTSGGSSDIGNREYLDAVVGGTVAWNQAVRDEASPNETNFAPIVTVTDAVEDAAGVKVKIEPVQDLHGYDHPWPAGGGANKLGPVALKATIANITGSSDGADSDGQYVVIPQNAYINNVVLFDAFEENKQYSIFYKCKPSGVQNTNIRIFYTDGTAQTLSSSSADTLINAVYVTDASKSVSKIGLGYWYLSSTKVYYDSWCIMEGSHTLSDFAPYSNICPITGWDGVKVWDDPVHGGTIEWNQYVHELSESYFSSSNCTVEYNDGVATLTNPTARYAAIRSYNYLGDDIKTDHKVLLYCEVKLTQARRPPSLYYNNTKWQGGYSGSSRPEVEPNVWEPLSVITTAKTPSGSTSGVIVIQNDNADYDGYEFSVRNVQFFDLTQMFGAGNEPTTIEEFRTLFPADYYPYNEGEITTVSAVNGDPYRHYSITLPTEAGTVYGGELTVNADGSGSLVVAKAYGTISNSRGISRKENVGHFWYTTTQTLQLPDPKGTNEGFICDRLAKNDYTAESSPDNSITLYNNGTIRWKEPSNAVPSEYNAYLAENPIHFVYDIAQPTTYQLTASQITTLLGQNNVWSNAGQTALTYTGTDEHLVLESGKKYLARISGTDSMLLGSGQEITAAKGTDNVFDLTQMFGTAVADYVYGQGASFFRRWFGKQWYPYNAGELKHVDGLSAHDMTGFNQWDEEWELGTINPNNGQNKAGTANIRSTNYIPVFPNTEYFSAGATILVFYYDESKNLIRYIYRTNQTFITPDNCRYIRFNAGTDYGTTYKHDICINIAHNGSRNGEYEPYEKHSYPLDSTVILRGIPKVGANGVYWDGDRYLPDGTVERRYGVVDLGTLSWGVNNAEARIYQCFPPNMKWVVEPPYTNRQNGVICLRYSASEIFAISRSMDDKAWLRTDNQFFIRDTSYANAAAFKAAMSGVLLVYELATPTTETAQPYHSTQWVSDWGTEEFVSTGIVPVGSETRYPANLRDKLQHLPDAASGNGSYLITQTDGQMVLTPFPAPPSTAGNYVLKATVVNGVATYTWEVAT